MDRRLQAGLAAATVAGLTAVVAVVVAHSPRHEIDPTSVVQLGTVDQGAIQATFLVRGAGCPVPDGTKDKAGRTVKQPEQRVHRPAVQYTSHTVDVGFKVEDPGSYRCTSVDPGVAYALTFPVALAGRTMRDSDHSPPTPFPIQTGRPSPAPFQ
ncbi:MAG TPA: hypothetical protein VHU88_08165 [Sporichthyaceae bacterium]|jgi:hypothetical protein|nr:hypothetical protein [Sporichthyaceae bacterium]